MRSKSQPQPFTRLAKTTHRGDGAVFGIKPADRRHHIYVIGKTGSGKTTLLQNLAIQDIENGNGLAVIDPHGDMAEALLGHVPGRRIDDVVYFDPSDLDWPIGLNLLEQVAPDKRHLVASSVVSSFKSIWRDSWGPRLEYILHNTILALLDYDQATLLAIPRMLSDELFRERIVRRVRDPIVRHFWTEEYARYPEGFRQEAIAPIQNKVGRFLSNAPIRNIVGQVRSKIDLRFMMDDGRILIANLAKGKIGEDKANLLGSLLVSAFQLAALSRADQAEHLRRDFHLTIDEFHNFSTDSFESILSEARKYRLSLTLAHQYLEQLPEPIRAAVFGNVGTLLTFRVGNLDAEILARELAPVFSAEDLANLDRYHLALRLMIDGQASRAFSAASLPPLRSVLHDRVDTVRRRSREKYARRRHIIENKIARWLGD